MLKYSCKNCDAELYWDSESNSLKCDYCGNSYLPKDFADATHQTVKAEEADKTDAVTDDSEGLEYVKYQCTNCGAEVVTAKGTIATTCAYCGRALSITDKMINNFKPSVVIPFRIGKSKATKIYEQYCKSSWLTPKEFMDPENIKKIKGIYAPFWLHSFTENSTTILYCEKVRSYRRGNDKVTTTKQYHVSIDATSKFDHIPADALSKLDNTLMQSIEPFNYKHLKKFDPAYLAGFYAEEFNEDPETTFVAAHERAVKAIKDCCEGSVCGYSNKRIINYDGQYSNRKASYAMLPVWLINVEYKGNKYTFAINGDTGDIAGQIPMSITKRILFGAATAIITYLIITIIKLICWF